MAPAVILKVASLGRKSIAHVRNWGDQRSPASGDRMITERGFQIANFKVQIRSDFRSAMGERSVGSGDRMIADPRFQIFQIISDRQFQSSDYVRFHAF
jgi:hypothetical protein